jgi:hypothetical protein
VFALDTTGSMSGLIEGAKKKIWSLASFVAQGQPTPDLRVGLIAYRDIGDAYVTKVYDLDPDLDRVYRRLRSFHAEGGGDGPEHVARALHESVHKMSWSQEQSVVKVIYLVGDAPPHTDYDDGYDYVRAARAAGSKGIQLHTIQCGTDTTARARGGRSRRWAAVSSWRFIRTAACRKSTRATTTSWRGCTTSWAVPRSVTARRRRRSRRRRRRPRGSRVGQGGACGIHGEEQEGGRR